MLVKPLGTVSPHPLSAIRCMATIEPRYTSSSGLRSPFTGGALILLAPENRKMWLTSGCDSVGGSAAPLNSKGARQRRHAPVTAYSHPEVDRIWGI